CSEHWGSHSPGVRVVEKVSQSTQGANDMKRQLTAVAALVSGLLFAAAWAVADERINDGTSCTLLIFNTNALADEKGWVQLFNGKDLAGWKLHPQPNKREIAEV